MIAMRGLVCAAALATLALSGCAKKPAIARPAPLAAADELVRQGCYDCLLEARSAYEQLTPRLPAAILKLFETNVLLALREKELALDSASHLAEAASLIPRLPKIAAEPVLSMVKVLPEDATGRR